MYGGTQVGDRICLDLKSIEGTLWKDVKANNSFAGADGTHPAAQFGADNNNSTATCKQTDNNVEPDETLPTIEIGTDGTASKDSGSRPKDVAENSNGTPPANEMETDNAKINEASASTAKVNSRKADNPKNAIGASPTIFQSSKNAYMNALLDAMSPENKALIAMPAETLIPKVCKPLNPAFRKGKQKIRDHRFRTLEAAYSGHKPLDYFEADIDTVELPPFKPNVATLVFLYVLDDYGYVLDADFRVFDDAASNFAREIESDTSLDVFGERSRRVFEGCGDPGAIATPWRLFPEPPRIDRYFNETIWGSPGLPSTVIPPEKLKSRLPKPATPKLKAAKKRDGYQTLSAAPTVLTPMPDNGDEVQTLLTTSTVFALVPDSRDEVQTPSATPTVLAPVPDNGDEVQTPSAAATVIAPVPEDREEVQTPLAATKVLAPVPDHRDEVQTASTGPTVLTPSPEGQNEDQIPSAAPTVHAPGPDSQEEDQTPSTAPMVLATVPRKTMIPMSAPNPHIRAVREVGLARSKNHLLSHEQNLEQFNANSVFLQSSSVKHVAGIRQFRFHQFASIGALLGSLQKMPLNQRMVSTPK